MVVGLAADELDGHVDGGGLDGLVGAEDHGRRHEVGGADDPGQGDRLRGVEGSEPSGDSGALDVSRTW